MGVWSMPCRFKSILMVRRMLCGLLAWGCLPYGAQADFVESLIESPQGVVLSDGSEASSGSVQLRCMVQPVEDNVGTIVTFSLQNRSDKPLAIREVVLYDWKHGLPLESAFYGEGYTMLSQTATPGRTSPQSALTG